MSTDCIINPIDGTLPPISIIDLTYLRVLDRSLLQGSTPEVILARQFLEGDRLNFLDIERVVVDGVSCTAYNCSSSELRLSGFAGGPHTRFLIPLKHSRRFNERNTLLYAEDKREYYFENLSEVTFVYKGAKPLSGSMDRWDAYLPGRETPVCISISAKYRNKDWVTFAGYAYLLRSLLYRKLYLPHYGVARVDSGALISALAYHYYLSCEKISDSVERQDHLKAIGGNLDSLPLIQVLMHDMACGKEYGLHYDERLPIEVNRELLGMPYLGKKLEVRKFWDPGFGQ